MRILLECFCRQQTILESGLRGRRIRWLHLAGGRENYIFTILQITRKIVRLKRMRMRKLRLSIGAN
jgi:hypothetical protein